MCSLQLRRSRDYVPLSESLMYMAATASVIHHASEIIPAPGLGQKQHKVQHLEWQGGVV